uniref:NR LBD domain-containing protein n=1 Tax=Caenorhabditis tropicalis TaxID=1561998 RepID=A0A1I7UD06_9PELO
MKAVKEILMLFFIPINISPNELFYLVQSHFLRFKSNTFEFLPAKLSQNGLEMESLKLIEYEKLLKLFLMI